MGSHLTKYTHTPVDIKARVSAIVIKETKEEAKKRKRKSAKNKPPIKRRIFLLEDVRKLDGTLLLAHSFIYDDCIVQFSDVQVGDTIYFKDINFYAFGKPIFDHDSEFNLVYSHCIEFTSENIEEISSNRTITYMLHIGVGTYVYTATYYSEEQAKLFKNCNSDVMVCRHLKDCSEYEPYNQISTKEEFVHILNLYAK